MTSFTAFIQPFLQHGFLQQAMLAGLLASVPCGVVGSYVVIRRISYIAGGIAHSVLAGLGLVHYLTVVHGVEGLSPIGGAVAAALVAALVIGWVSLNLKQREDTVIGAVWAMGMAAGIVFISLTPGYTTDLMSYLFGNILMVTDADLWLLAGLDVVVLVVVALFHRQLLAVCFDPEFAGLRGVRVNRYYFLLLLLTALTVVVLVSVVGIILVIALLTLPAAVANHHMHRLGRMMVGATVITVVLTAGGLVLSYGPDLPSGAVTILLAGFLFILSSMLRRH